MLLLDCSCDVLLRFHVDKLSSAHVYLRCPKGTDFDSIPKDVLDDCCQLVKANSIQGNFFTLAVERPSVIVAFGKFTAHGHTSKQTCQPGTALTKQPQPEPFTARPEASWVKRRVSHP